MRSEDDDDQPASEGSETFDALLRDVARTAPAEPPGADLANTTFGQYRVTALIARGGMGIVYRATDARLGRDVAIKVLPRSFADDQERRRRFLREARTAAAINHPNIATIYEVGEVDGRLFLAMERVEGTTLRARLTADGLSQAEVLRIARQIAAGLASAHEKGIVHRDLKPENVMITRDGDAKILDFGLAKVRQGGAIDAAPTSGRSALTQEGRVMGTPGYMSPEQATGKSVDERTDVYALGVVLHEMITGELPGAHGSGRRATDPAVAAIITRCLARAPEDRWANGGAFVTALDALDRTSRATTSDAARPSGRAVPRWAIATGGGVLAIACGIAWSATQGPRAGVDAARPVASSAASTATLAEGACSSNRACVAAHGGAPWHCNTERHTCEEIASPDCKAYVEPHEAEAEDIVWIGGMFPLSTDPALVSEMRATDLARQDFARALGASEARSGALHARPIGLVICDEGREPMRAAHHLADDVQVPAVIGFRTSESALTTISTVFLPAHVLSFVSISQNPELTRIPEPTNEPRLVWRSTLNRDDAAAPMAHLVSEFLEPRARGPHGIGDRPFKVAAVWAKATNHDTVESLFTELRFNGRSALENGANFRQIVHDSEADAADGAAVDALLAFAPQVIVFGDQSFNSKVLLPLEASWSQGPRPFYLTTSGFSPEVWAFAGHDPSRRHRFFAVTNVSTTLVNVELVLRYNMAFPAEPIAPSEAPQPSYDAFYMLAYATAALGDGAVTGPALSRALQRLLPPGRRVDEGPAHIFDAFQTLRSSADARIDLDGALGSLDFDVTTGEAPIDYAIVCLGIDDHGAASAPIDSGLVYDARARKLVGALRCP